MNSKQELVMYVKTLKFMEKYKLSYRYSIRNLLKDLKINLISYENMDILALISISEDAFSVFDKGKRYVFYNPYQKEERINFTLAHELGHFLFEHHKHRKDKILAFGERGAIESQANVFARNLLMPVSRVDDYAETKNISELAEIFEVSNQMAKIRMAHLECDRKWLTYVSKNF